MIYVFTSCALNFLPSAKALFRSAEQHLPNAKRILFLADHVPEDFDVQAEGADELMTLDHFTDEFSQPAAWRFCHNVMELSTALKPFVLEKLLQRDDCEAVLFFDCDCVLYSSLDVIFAGLEKASILLTPHACKPHLNKELMAFEFRPLKTGVFNLGFFAVRNGDTGQHFAKWWKERLRYYCWIDFDLGVFTDQKWVEFVPCYFDDFLILRNSSLNVARWNTFQRKIQMTKEGQILIDDMPADFIHFSGFYKVGGFVKGLYDDESAAFCSDKHAMDALSEWYANHIKADAERELCQREWAFDYFSNGEKIHQEQREYFRKHYNSLSARFHNPFVAEGDDCFLDFYRELNPKDTGSSIELSKQVNILENRLNEIYRSRSWKVASALSQVHDVFKKLSKTN